jgi:IMP dehydrogenase
MSFLKERVVEEGMSFDDVLLIPSYSEVLPREVSLRGRFSRNIPLDTPLASAAMDTVTEAPMAIALAKAGGIGVIHKNMDIPSQAAEVAKVKAAGPYKVAAGVGITEDALQRIEALAEAGVDAVVLDSAHGHSKGVGTKLAEVKKAFPSIDVVVGNVATAEGAKYLVDNGADAVKVGIGPGSICTTRVVAGIGMPQLTAIYNVYKALEGTDVPLIADGGLRYSGDLVKAFAAGADCVMCGRILAGTDETPGEVVTGYDGQKYKTYRGMGSLEAMRAGSSDRYFQKGAKKLVPEGIVGSVPYRGSVDDVIFQLLGGIRAGMGYLGASTIAGLRSAKFVRITQSGVRENHPHDVKIAKQAPNYKPLD